jgi:hypothetical protein
MWSVGTHQNCYIFYFIFHAHCMRLVCRTQKMRVFFQKIKIKLIMKKWQKCEILVAVNVIYLMELIFFKLVVFFLMNLMNFFCYHLDNLNIIIKLYKLTKILIFLKILFLYRYPYHTRYHTRTYTIHVPNILKLKICLIREISC